MSKPTKAKARVNKLKNLVDFPVQNRRMLSLLQTELNKTKSGYILMGTEEQLAEARQRMKEEPMMCNEFVMMATTLQED